ncbi:hypothetical protein IGI04_037204 [Brassica rapa subsp. trilocularis]|uniref:Uncharacterized protein n=1 Tax=Brassica rapa subsp. trilocularis TaxID=1813537 RepID=A0ABQ7LGQ3_BRACM|nr:hypothetical protein IGI04_037204 [Brassica rapa subsp. trilocularis]
MAATKMFLIKWYSSSINLKVFQIWKTSGTTYLLVVWKSSGLLGSLLTKSSGLPGSRLDFSERFGKFLCLIFLHLVFQIWKTSGTTYLLVVWKSSGSRLDFLKVVWTSCKVVWKSSELPKSLLNFVSSGLVYSSGIQACGLFCELHVYSFSCEFFVKSDLPGLTRISEKNPGRLTIKSSGGRLNYKSSVRLKCKSSGEVKLLKLSIDDLTFSRLRLQISKSIAKITSALTRRLPGKSSTARRRKSSTARRLPNSLAYIRLLQAHRITNESHPPRIVSFYDSMNHKNFRIKILGFFSSLWRESERYVVFSSQEWKKKKGKSILGALRASNWLFMVVVVLISMVIL